MWWILSLAVCQQETNACSSCLVGSWTMPQQVLLLLSRFVWQVHSHRLSCLQDSEQVATVTGTMCKEQLDGGYIGTLNQLLFSKNGLYAGGACLC